MSRDFIAYLKLKDGKGRQLSAGRCAVRLAGKWVEKEQPTILKRSTNREEVRDFMILYNKDLVRARRRWRTRTRRSGEKLARCAPAFRGCQQEYVQETKAKLARVLAGEIVEA